MTKLFDYLSENVILFNQCWEDPRVDRQLLNIDDESHILMITSAGCNALDYLLDNPVSIDCVDRNPCQTALANLKFAAIKNLDYDDLFALFGDGQHRQVKDIYKNSLQEYLPDTCRKYWDRKIRIFQGTGFRKTFYEHGAPAAGIYLFKFLCLTNPKIRDVYEEYLECADLERQKEIFFGYFYPVLDKLVSSFLSKFEFLAYTTGVPAAQQKLIKKEYNDSPVGFWLNRVSNVMSSIPMNDNYFWRVYLKGGYTKENCPNYLKRENAAVLKDRTNRINVTTDSLFTYLQSSEKLYTHVILLDSQDWFWDDQQGIRNLWELVFRKTKKGSKILFRSAATSCNFIPVDIREKLWFDENSDSLHKIDRVGTYGSTHLGVRIS